MSAVNRTPRPTLHTTYGGTQAEPLGTPIQQLRRATLTCLLWEDNFYEKGSDQAARIQSLVPKCTFEDVARLAVELRHAHHLRHVPLLLVRELLRKPVGAKGGRLLTEVIGRADEITEFLALYWKDGKKPLSKQVRAGLAAAFRKFDAYQLAKYDRKENPIRLRDVMMLVHAKPQFGRRGYDKHARMAFGGNADLSELGALNRHEETYKQLIDGTLPTPLTWETELSAGKDKKETFESLLRARKLGYLALLRNLRNMDDSGVDRELVAASIVDMAGKSRALPFRFIAAAKAAPSYSALLERGMLTSLSKLPRLLGRTMVLIDVSGSMDYAMGGKSDLTRIDAALGLAMLVRGVGQAVAFATFSNEVVLVDPQAEGFRLAESIVGSQAHGGTYMGRAVQRIMDERSNGLAYDRLIVITDEQSSDAVPAALIGIPHYIINVASYAHGVENKGGWHKIHGWSEAVVAYIQALEGEKQ